MKPDWNNFVTPWGPIGYPVYKRTYARRLDDKKGDSDTEEFPDTVERLIKAFRTQLKCGFTEEEEDRLRYYLLGLKGTVAGRFLWQLGTKTVNKLGLPSLQNCFSADTRFYTSDGIKSFSEFKDGDSVMVRGRKGWKKATVKNFGKQEIVKLTMTRGPKTSYSVNTTKNHRWITEDGIKTTEELVKGDTLKEFENTINYQNIQICPVGIQHGIVFGDGHKASNNTSTSITVCGDSIEEIRAFFPKSKANMISGLPYFYKELPCLEKVNNHYLLGFIAGWIAADGHVTEKGTVTLANKDQKVLDWFRTACVKVGIKTGPVGISREISPFDNSEKPLFRVSIFANSVPEQIILLEKHKKNINRNQYSYKWRVSEVSDVVDIADVWCVVEPENEEFTLENGVLTKNCAFVTVDSPIRPFTWAMDLLMLGCGVGFNIQKENVYQLPKLQKKRPSIKRLDTSAADYIVPDTREGWVKLLGKVLKSYFYSGEGFTYSTQLVRGQGAVIKGFGGVASGPEILVEGIEYICDVLDKCRGDRLRPIDCLDIMCIIGMIVVAGNVRRSALIAIGDCDDLEYLKAKRWDLGILPKWRSNSNNSVVCNDINDLPSEFWELYNGNSEPYGLINLSLSRECGRIGETQYPDPNVQGFNPLMLAA